MFYFHRKSTYIFSNNDCKYDKINYEIVDIFGGRGLYYILQNQLQIKVGCRSLKRFLIIKQRLSLHLSMDILISKYRRSLYYKKWRQNRCLKILTIGHRPTFFPLIPATIIITSSQINYYSKA